MQGNELNPFGEYVTKQQKIHQVVAIEISRNTDFVIKINLNTTTYELHIDIKFCLTTKNVLVEVD